MPVVVLAVSRSRHCIGLRVVCWLANLWAAVSWLCACDVYRPELVGTARQDAAPIDERAGAGSGTTRTGSVSGPDPNAFSTTPCERGQCWWSLARDGCESAGLPGLQFRPAADADPRGAELYLGLTALQMVTAAAPGRSDSPDAQSFGLDLDDVCTNSPSCADVQPVVSCRSLTTQLPFDSDNCRDNIFARLMAMVGRLPDIADRFGLHDGAFNCELWRGGYNLLVRLTGYNGSSDDGSVRVDWYTSNGLEQMPGWRCPELDFTTKHARWSSDAPWSISADELTGEVTERGHLPASRVSDPNAYVRGGYLVSRLPDGALLRFAGDAEPLRGFAMPVYQSLWLGRLVRSANAGWAITDGLIAGRVRTEDLLRSFRQTGFCTMGELGSLLDSIENYIEESADLLASGQSAPEQTCDAMSFGIAFSAAQVTPGLAWRPLEPLIECCEPGVPAEYCRSRCGDGKVSGDERCDTAIASDQPGACATRCSPRNACETRTLQGSGCDVHCLAQPVVGNVAGDGCCAPGANVRIDTDCGSTCGNGVLEPGETCDPPSVCPSCVTEDKCLRVARSGSAETCDMRCTATAVSECRSEDGCCPQNCTRGADNDCSSRCGDGRVEPGSTETCESNTPSMCPTSCDDRTACTIDIETGSVANCNVRCSHWPVTAPVSGDDCCPSGADSSSDSDC